MALVQSSLIADQLRRLLDLRGAAPQLELLEQVIPIVVAGDLRDTVSPSRPRVFVGGGEQPTVAGQFSYLVLANVTTDADFIVHRINFAGAAPIRFSVGWEQSGFATPNALPSRSTDSAFKDTGSTGRVYSGSAAALPTVLIFDTFTRLANDDREHRWAVPPIVRPGHFLVVYSNTLAQPIYGAFEWEEKPRT